MAQQVRAPDSSRSKAPVDPFPVSGNVRVKQAAAYLGIGISTYWKYVKEGRINQPMRYGARVSVWSAEYVRGLAVNGIPAATPKGSVVT